jgi:hypothetical protein
MKKKLVMWQHMRDLLSNAWGRCDHSLIHCTYARRIWNERLPYMLHKTTQRAIKQSQLAAASCWNIWKERNHHMFQNTNRTSEMLLVRIITNGLLWDHIWILCPHFSRFVIYCKISSLCTYIYLLSSLLGLFKSMSIRITFQYDYDF